MTDYPPEISEEKMRAALMLLDGPIKPSAASAATAFKQRRRFVQDGEVRVEMVPSRQHRPDPDDRSGQTIAKLTHDLSVARTAQFRLEKELQAVKEQMKHWQVRCAHAELALREAKSSVPVLVQPPAEPALMPVPRPVSPMAKLSRRRAAIGVKAGADSRNGAGVHTATGAADAACPGSDEEADQSVPWWEPGWRERYAARQR